MAQAIRSTPLQVTGDWLSIGNLGDTLLVLTPPHLPNYKARQKLAFLSVLSSDRMRKSRRRGTSMIVNPFVPRGSRPPGTGTDTMKYDAPELRHGYTNRVLEIDLGDSSIEAAELDPQVRDYFLGGRGLGLYLLHQATSATTKASDPENPLILANGPLGGIPQFPGTAKAMAVSLSPLTGVPGVSNFGGYFGAFLKFAGFDALQVTGKAGRDVMIVINGFSHEVTIEDISHLDESFDIERMVDEKFTTAGFDRRTIAFMSTGTGADHTTFGCINSHYFDVTKPTPTGKGLYRTKQAGRTGIGSVMSDKGVRAIVVLAPYPQGDNPYGAADWERAKDAGKRLHKVVKEVDPTSLRMSRKGSEI